MSNTAQRYSTRVYQSDTTVELPTAPAAKRYRSRIKGKPPRSVTMFWGGFLTLS